MLYLKINEYFLKAHVYIFRPNKKSDINVLSIYFPYCVTPEKKFDKLYCLN